jgi:ATP-binding cassette subfamily C protein LapB
MITLFPALLRLAQRQGQFLDKNAVLVTMTDSAQKQTDPHKQLQAFAQHWPSLHLLWPQPRQVDPTCLPCLVHRPQTGWAVLHSQSAQGQWVLESWSTAQSGWQEITLPTLDDVLVAQLRFEKSNDASPVVAQIKRALGTRRKELLEALAGSVMINLVALAASMYSMQVYDRVIPTSASQTLWVLTLGVIGATGFELLAKWTRSRLYENVVDHVDQHLARAVYAKFLAIRLDQMPRKVGALASQLRGYETIRQFLTASATQWLVEIPFALVFTGIVVMLGGALAAIPLAFLAASVALGLWSHRRIEQLGVQAQQASHRKTGLLVEAIEGAETIKSGQSGWRMLTRWMQNVDQARLEENQMRQLGEHNQYLIAAMQQLSYVLMVAIGALWVSHGEMTMGALIACTILSGRILTPVSQLPSQITQWAHAKAALKSLEQLWALQDDHHGIDHPIVLSNVRGDYLIDKLQFSHGVTAALHIPRLHIAAGQKIGVLGPIGSGKTTLLRMLSGMYKPQLGTITLDGIDLSHIAKPVLSERLGYLQQEGRLFAGTLRENLILGLPDPGDEAILAAANETGLLANVIQPHPQGLHQTIDEGGAGLSGGQRQLLNFTRVILRRPRIWLLDDPTASMDKHIEQRIIQVLKHRLRPEDTLVMVTHKSELLELVDRVIVIAQHQIVLDEAKHSALARLAGHTPPHGAET